MSTTITRDDAASALADLVAGTTDAREHLAAGNDDLAGTLALDVAMRLWSMDAVVLRQLLAAALDALADEMTA